MTQLSKPDSPNFEKGDRPVFHAAQAALLSIPGHAQYYRDRILNARLEYEKVKGQGEIEKEAGTRTELSNAQTEGFRTMAYLPSVETVRVLGEFLADERGYTKLPPDPTMKEIQEAGREVPNCKGAAKALVCLPFVSKPLDKNWMTLTYEDVAPWREWYEQIKAGNRTFRFEGDPTEYDLNGPASRQALDRIARADKRDTERADGTRKGPHQKGAKDQSFFGNWGVILGVASGVLLVFLVGYGWVRAGKPS
ncbi:MAG: hypothetical protein EOP88_11870 [Verrucomicrobiaceae bacterium]|nr:MAG: hypothetical protein EOP88_11870 [Verrucomicrobiaceae bacterium]